MKLDIRATVIILAILYFVGVDGGYKLGKIMEHHQASAAPPGLTEEEKAAVPTMTNDYDQSVEDLRAACENISRNSDVFDDDNVLYRACLKTLKIIKQEQK